MAMPKVIHAGLAKHSFSSSSRNKGWQAHLILVFDVDSVTLTVGTVGERISLDCPINIHESLIAESLNPVACCFFVLLDCLSVLLSCACAANDAMLLAQALSGLRQLTTGISNWFIVGLVLRPRIQSPTLLPGSPRTCWDLDLSVQF